MNTQSPSQSDLTVLLGHYQNARYENAYSLAIALTEQYPNHPLAWKVLGAVLMTAGNIQGALLANETASRLDPQDAIALYNLSNTLKALGRLDAAELGYKNSILLKPDFAEAYLNLGVLLQESGRLEDAEASYKKALAANSSYAQLHNNLGNVLRELGRFEDAEACYKNAIALSPEYVEAHSNLGIALQGLRRLHDAEACYKKAIALKPDFAQAHYNLGVVLQESSRLSEAKDSYSSAIALRKNYYEAHYNQGLVLLALGDVTAALQEAVDLLGLKPTIDAKGLFVEALKNISVTSWDLSLANMVATALIEPWGRPADIGPFACQLLKSDPEIQKALHDLASNTSRDTDGNGRKYPFPRNDLASLPLLNAIMTSGPIADGELEKYFTGLRYQLLNIANANLTDQTNSDESESFYCALAQQCFINEYVYYQTPLEIDLSLTLRDRLLKALEDRGEVPVSLLLAVACYLPLYKLEHSETLLGKSYSTEVMAVLKQQIQEPLEEIRLRQLTPSLTDVDNQISLAVQDQYEENPYPRWVRLPHLATDNFLNSFIAKKYPLSDYRPLGDDQLLEVLIAGCGTGQHSIGCAQLTKGAKILAVDLSIASLAYAKRKTMEMGIDSIEYAQADILKLPSIGRKFDLIESVGVLHHMDKPFEGWEALISMLKPNGLMRLGFYSELARRDIVQVRSMISQSGIESSSQDIRNYRRDLLELNDSQELQYARKGIDFYSMSACRDLIFHVQEHRMQLDQIAQFLDTHQLKFLGFDIERGVIESYKLRFPDDLSATNLNNWHIYEQENPHTFTAMYQFLVQKKL